MRTEVGLVVETGEARQLHDFCLLAGYGAEAINPYLAFDTIASLRRDLGEVAEAEAHKRYIKGVAKGIMKVMSKMGICTFQSYCGAQIFDAVGLASAFLDKYFTGTVSPVEGAGLDEIAEETVRRHRLAYGDAPNYRARARSRRRDPVPRQRRDAYLDFGDGVAAAARRAHRRLPPLPRLHQARR